MGTNSKLLKKLKERNANARIKNEGVDAGFVQGAFQVCCVVCCCCWLMFEWCVAAGCAAWSGRCFA